MISFETNLVLIIGLFSFFMGSIPTGLIVTRSKGIDIRKLGSGNIGATNVLRTMGAKYALITLAGDISKGIIPVALIPIILRQFSLDNINYEFNLSGQIYLVNSKVLFQAIAGLCAVLGHNFSIFLGFKGGKGVATSLGVVLSLSPHAGLMTVTTWLITMRFSRISSLSALIAFALTPFYVYAIDPSREKVFFVIILTILVFIRHKDNIKRLLEGKESKFGNKK
ncbi:MAG TPA: glycerol-3-phosphate 1-O-acyltransferase PlsY [Nitrospirae bacterium]|nr:glycerol-3-phosphate 1-O-acyltransferase PlsY [Nitrospirota bacterium]